MKCMKAIGVLLAAGAVASAQPCFGRTVGILKDARSGITEGMIKTLEAGGWKTEILSIQDIAGEEKTRDVDVIFLPGGFNAYNFADFKARRAMVRFVAGGKGILAGAVRGGYVRTSNRPLFPQIGAAHNRVNGPYILAQGDSELARAIDQPFCPGGWDHVVIKVGPQGKVFAVSGSDPVGVCGEVHGGRYLLFGAFIGGDTKTNLMTGTSRVVLLKMLDWLASAPKPGDAGRAGNQAQADLEFLRREATWDWTVNERGPDRSPGVLPAIRNRLALALQTRQYTLQYMGRFLSGKQADQCRAAEDELKNAVADLDKKFQKAMSEKKSAIGRMSAKDLALENPLLNRSNVLALVMSAPGRTDAEKKAMAAGIGADGAPKAVAEFLNGNAIREQFIPGARLKELTDRGDKVIAALKPAVKAAKAALLAEERKRDAEAVPGLIGQCASADAASRREAARELGRIGSAQSEPALVKLLNDSDAEVRVNAVLALGWMQGRSAVPALIEALGKSDLEMRRRAAQALGQIGDERAIKPLLGLVADKDHATAMNAIFSLGWLKAKAAVPDLLRIATATDKKGEDAGMTRQAAIRALGHIGDPAALSALEDLAKNANDAPTAKRIGRIPNIYSTKLMLGLGVYSDLAIAEIRAGGRAGLGVRQPEFLSARDKFYSFSGHFNALAGRPFTGTSDPALLWPYLWEAGMTGIHQAWGSADVDPEKYHEAIRVAGELDLRWIDVMPGCGGHGADKSGAEVVMQKFWNEPAFQGFWYEETYPESSIPAPEFDAWLRKKYGADYSKKLGLTSDAAVLGRDWNSWSDSGGYNANATNQYSGPLKSEFLECAADRQLGLWKESRDWMRGLRKGFAFTYSVSDAQPLKFIGLTAKAGDVIDVNGPETYQSFGRFNSFFMEIHKNGEPRPVMCEFYNWYSPSPARDIRGFAQHLMHGECYYNFHLDHIFEHASYYNLWSWEETRWNDAKKIFGKARGIREYLAVPESAANVGLVLSERSILPFDPVNFLVGGLRQGWMQYQSALWTALNQAWIPTDIIWAETLSPDKLKRYRVLVMSAARIVTGEQAKMLRDWVADGGTLIASGTTSLYDDWAREQKEYRLADLFGVSYAGHAGEADPAKCDTTYWKMGNLEPAEKVKFGLDPDTFKHYIHRDVKPVKSLGTYAVSGGKEAMLPGVAAGAACEYDMPLGYDRVKPGSAEVLAKFANGDPALTVNRVGKGLCYFWTPLYPALSHTTSEWDVYPNILDFWPNVRELLAGMVKGGLANQKAALPVELSGVSKEVEVTVRQQAGRNRCMIHLLDYDQKSDSVKGANLIVRPPAGKTVKRMFHPDTGAEVAFTAVEGGVAAKLRDFSIHDMVVAEWQ